MLLLADKDIIFLKWLYNRVKYRYNDSDVLLSLQNIINKISTRQTVNLNNSQLDTILIKYYADFNMEKSEIFGYTEEERTLLRKNMISLCNDIINYKE